MAALVLNALWPGAVARGGANLGRVPSDPTQGVLSPEARAVAELATKAPVHPGRAVQVSWSIPGTNAYFGFNDPTEAYDPASHSIYVAWMGATGIDFARSTDGGSSFLAALTLPGSGDFTNSTVISESWNPSIAVAPDGTVYVAFIDSNSTNPLPYPSTPVVDVSHDHGRSFSYSSAVLSHLRPLSLSDRPFLAVEPNGDLDLAFNYIPNLNRLNLTTLLGNVVFTRSTDGGHHWSRLVRVSPDYPTSGAYPIDLLAEPSGQLDLLYGQFPTNWTTLQSQPGRLYFVESTSNGTVWSSPLALGSAHYPLSPASVEIQGSEAQARNGNLYVVYESQYPTREIGWLVDSTDHGKTWSAPLRIFSGSYTDRGPDGTPAMMNVVAGPGCSVFIAWVWNNSASGSWSAHLRIYDPGNGSLSSTYDLTAQPGAATVFPGTLIGLVEIDPTHLSLATGMGYLQNGSLVDEIVNIVTRVA